MRTCPRCAEENPPHARFCLACGGVLDGGGVESRRPVTVLFCDLTGSTALGDRQDPEQLRRVLSRYADEARTVIERHGGTVEKFIGDAVMAVFGMPVVHEDDALRAARAAVDLRAGLSRLNVELDRELGITIQTRTGINSGEVIAGDASRGESFVTGDVVNVAKRLEENAGAGEILIGQETYRLARDALVVELLPPIAAKGKAEPVTAYRLADVTSGALPHARRSDSPMVGRDRELELVRRSFEQAVADRACHLLTILGPAGAGKSRLVLEALRDIDHEAEILRGACLPYGEGITFWPVIEVVRQATGVTEADPPERAREKIAASVAGDEAAELVGERLARAIGLSEDVTSAHDIFWALRRLLEAKARLRPLVVVLDDVHWGEPTFLDLVEHLPDWSRDAPVLLLCMARPELLDVRPGWAAPRRSATTLTLEPLADDETHALIRNLAGDVDEAILSRVVTTAEGNPLFVEEMLAMLVEEGADTASIPSTIQVLLAARLDRLEPGERRVLECAAVEGAEFHGGAVAALAREPVGDALFGLVRKDLIRPHRAGFAGEDGFRFRHILFRDAAYDTLPKSRRASLHERYAAWLEDVARDRILEYEELLGFHREQAFRCRSEIAVVDEAARALAGRAAGHLAAAGRRAAARGDMTAAANLLGRASRLLGDGDDARAEVLIDLGAALGETAELRRAGAVLEEAIAAAERTGRVSLADRARVELSYLRLHLDPSYSMDEAAAVAERASRVFEQSGDDLGLSRALQHLALVHWARCRLGDMERVLERALVHAERAGDERGVSEILDGLCRATLLGPNRVEIGIRRCEETLGRARTDLRLEATANQVLAMLLSMQSRFEEARSLLRRASASFGELGLTVRRATVATYAAFVELYANDPRAAEEWLRDAYEALERMGERSRFSTVAALLAQSLSAQGRLEEAEACAAASEEAASPDDVVSQVIWRIARAKVLLARAQVEEAVALSRAAVDLASGTDFPNLQGDALVGLADALQASGRRDEARDCLVAAAGLYAAKGNDVSAATLEARLRALETAGRA
jgi:class 3 adenylate cyclase/tetratricopeptide (TPR) repeat protein